MKKLRDFIQKNIIQNVFVKYKRQYKTSGLNINFLKNIKLNRRILIIFLLVVAGLFILVNFIGKGLSIQLKRDSEDLSTLNTNIYDENRYSVVLLGFNDTNKDTDYRFLDYITQIKIDSKKSDIRLFGINPQIIVPKGYEEFTLSSFINNVEDSSEKFKELINKLTNLSTQNVDRYISFNYSDLDEITELLGINYRAVNSIKTSNRFYTKDAYVSGKDLGDFFTLRSGDNIAHNLEEKISFFKDFHLSLKNPFKNFNLLQNSDKLSNLLKTNMNSHELRKFLADLSYGDVMRQDYTNIEDYFLIPEKYEDGFKVSDVLLDEKLLGIFSRIEIISEQAKIEIYNASDISGLAYQYKRRLENQGSTVVKTGNYPEKPKENTLYIPNSNRDNFKETVNQINSILEGDVTIVTGEYKYNYSGDLILVLVK